MFEKLKVLIEKIIEYTKTWSITETEWYWNIECVRKPNNTNDKEITWKEFEVSIREEILYDLIYNNGKGIENQMNNDYESGYEDERFFKERKELEKEIQKYISDFKLYKGEK